MPQYGCSFRHIQAHSIMTDIATLTFFFITLILHAFQGNLKRHMFFDYNDVDFNARLSILK